MFRPSYASIVAADKTFFRALFSDRTIRIVFDIGANIGDKAEVFRDLSNRVICVEADPETASELSYRFRGATDVVVESAAVGAEVGEAKLMLKHHAGYNTLSEKWATEMDAQSLPTSGVVTVPLTTVDKLVQTYGQPDYIKIDVEGYELQVILGMSSAVRVLSFECNLPLFLSETDMVIQRLVELCPATLFNARVVDSPTWMLPAPVDAVGLRKMLENVGKVTIDVFAFA